MGAAPQGYVSATHARWLASAPDRRWRAVPATLVFADVSGFTAMSERLAKRGKIGAEETTEAVNRVFDGLLGATRAGGGELLKFGGDAVLAFFEGDAHEIRGAAAALQMQAAMKPLRRLRTAAGTVSLKLSAGVASGTAHLFLAGSAPRDLIVAGPLASEVVGCEAQADAGQVRLGTGTIAALPARCVTDDGRLRSVPLVPMTDIPEPPAGFDPRPALPLHLHDHVPGDGEHRLASIAFVQFKGTDALAAEPERLARALDEIVGGVEEACLAQGITLVSTDVDRDGGKIILAAGAPTSSPDDDDRLLHALRAVIERDWPIPLRIGANRGRIFMVDIGPEHRRVWSVMGDAVNLAARVMARAAPGELLATPAVLDHARDEFERTPIEPFMVKGKAAPVRADVVGAARGARRLVAFEPLDLVGRDAELATIDHALDASRSGERHVVELVGEPGIGKSRLVEAAVAHAHGTFPVSVAGGPYAALSPYRALRAPLRELLGTAPAADDRDVIAALRSRVAADVPQLEPWLPLIGLAFGLELPPTPETAALSPEFARARLHVAMGRLIEALLPPRPTLLVIEDAHWLDQASSELLSHLVDQQRPYGHVVLLTRRDTATGLSLSDREDATTLRLEPLGADAALRLATARGGGADEQPLAPSAVAQLVERSGGNPLLLQELLAAARAGEPLDALPDSVEALVTARIDTLPQSDRLILRQAAVLGNRVAVPMLTALLGWDALRVASALERLEAFLVSDGAQIVRFRHALLRDAAYEALPYRRRQELHGRAAELIEREAGADVAAQAELLAIHFHAARAWAGAWRYGQLAAGQALVRAAPVEAVGFLTRAVEAGRALGVSQVAPAELAGAATRLGDAAKLAGEVEQAAQAYALARRLVAGDPLATASLCFKTGRLHDGSRHIAQTLRWYTRGLTVLDSAGHATEAAALRAQLVLAHGAARMRAGRLRQSLPYLRRAVVEAQACGARESLAHAYYCLDATLTDLGDPEAREYRGLALPIYEELGDLAGQAKVLCNLGIDAYYEDRWDEAAEYYERSRAACDRIGDVIQIGTNHNNIGEIRADQGHLDEAEQLFEEALSIFRAAGFHFGAATVWANLGSVAAARGDVERAADLLARARTAFVSTGSDASVLDVDGREAERLVLAGRPKLALTLVDRVRGTAAALGESPRMMSKLARIAGAAHLALGRRTAAARCLREAIALAQSADAIYEEGLAWELLATAGNGDAEHAAAEAARILGGLGVVRYAPEPLATAPARR